MDTDDIGDISSFASQPHQKGLLTFYQEQWTKFSPKETPPIRLNEHQSKHELYKTDVEVKNEHHKLSHSLHESPKLPFLFAKNKLKPIEVKENPKITQKQFALSDKAQTLNLTILSQIKKQITKENQTKNIQANIFKKVAVKQKVKQRRILQSVHIQNYPFQQQQEQELVVNKAKKQVGVRQIKKGSPFKGFHRQNVSISVIELRKDGMQELRKDGMQELRKDGMQELRKGGMQELRKDGMQEVGGQGAKLLGRTLNKYEKYSCAKSVAKYMFPIISPRLISLKKGSQVFKNTESEDNLNKLFDRTHQRPCRNTTTGLSNHESSS